jgi:hypothetical protein
VDYPPGTVLVLWPRASTRWWRPACPTVRFNAAINMAPLLASLVIALLLRRSAEAGLGQRRALAFWLNPAVYLAAPVLGYQDPIFAALGLAAVNALMQGRHVRAAPLVAASALVKPQGVLLLRAGCRPPPARRGLARGPGSAGRAWPPRRHPPSVVDAGYLLSALDRVPPARQGTLAPLG